MDPISLDIRLQNTGKGHLPQKALKPAPVSLDSRLRDTKSLELMEIRAGRFPLEGQSLRCILRAIDLMEMDGIGLYGSEPFPLGILPPELLELIREPPRAQGEDPSFDGAAAYLWQLLWEEYHIGGSEKALARPRNPKRAEQLYRLLRELLVTPFLRIDALRRLPRPRSAPSTRTIRLWPVG